jgi:hypothetical protein
VAAAGAECFGFACLVTCTTRRSTCVRTSTGADFGAEGDASVGWLATA